VIKKTGAAVNKLVEWGGHKKSKTVNTSPFLISEDKVYSRDKLR
jgi:hypothetical protein